LPSTFRQAAGQMVEEDADLEESPKPRKTALIAAVVGAVVVAGLAAFFFTQQSSTNSATADTVATVAQPATPRTVKLSFKSDPAGAAVLRKDTNEQLGITPFAIEISASQTSVDFLFKKDNFGDRIESFVPAESGQLAVALTANAQPTNEAAHPHAEAKAENKAGGPAPASGHRKPGGARKHGGRAMDEDGVLAPSF
jgi:hypothetical protein